jgi:hypothetical protein
MSVNKRQTAGALQVKASGDKTKYDSREVGHALCDDVLQQLRICAEKHYNILDISEFCIVMMIADDPLIKGLMRRKFYAWPFLPKPRPRQGVFLYSKRTDDFRRLWVLPDPLTMATISEMNSVHKKYLTMKQWSDIFYQGISLKDPSVFWKYIRKQHEIEILSETEYLERNAEELIKSKTDEFCPIDSDTFDFFKGMPQQIVDTKTARFE